LDEAEDLLDSHPIGENPESTDGVYSLKFDGQITTLSGVTAQNLSEMLATEKDRPGLLAGAPKRGDALLRRLALARPDLKDRIAAQAGGPWHTALDDTFEIIPPDPLLLHGYAWEKTGEWIGTYGDLDTLLAWKYLEANLEVEHEFTHQLVPAIADDAFLHCRILSQLDFETDVGVFEKAIECLYVVDYGIWTIPGVGGKTIGWSRTIDYGVVVYAPTVGPIYSYERLLVHPSDSWNTGDGEITLDLIGATTVSD
jgi:hypothetical protein